MNYADALTHKRSCEKRTGRRGRRLCSLGGCPNACTHQGNANGCGMMQGCEFHVRMWVRSPADLLRSTQRMRRVAS